MSDEERQQQRDIHIFGEPVETEFGVVNFLTYKQYLLNIIDVSIIGMNVYHIYHELRKSIDLKDKELVEEVEGIKKESLYQIVGNIPRYLDAYIKIFSMVLEDDDKIYEIFSSEENFTYMRNLIMDMNMILEDEVSPNPEVQRGIEMSKKIKNKKSEKQSFVDIVTSVVASTSNSFEDVCNMTVFQVYSIFSRIGAIKEYDTATLFATVGGDTKKIESWAKHIDLYKQEVSAIEEKEFDMTYGSLLK